MNTMIKALLVATTLLASTTASAEYPIPLNDIPENGDTYYLNNIGQLGSPSVRYDAELHVDANGTGNIEISSLRVNFVTDTYHPQMGIYDPFNQTLVFAVRVPTDLKVHETRKCKLSGVDAVNYWFKCGGTQ